MRYKRKLSLPVIFSIASAGACNVLSVQSFLADDFSCSAVFFVLGAALGVFGSFLYEKFE